MAITQIKRGQILNSAIDTSKIADDAVTQAKIADDAVGPDQIADDAVLTAAIADSQVTTGKIAADAVNGSKIADDSIDSEHYVDGSIDTAHLSAGAVTLAKIAEAVYVTESEGIGSNDNDTTIPTSAAVKDYVDAVAAGLSWKESVRVATTGNITISTALNNGDTIDGVTLADGDRVLVKDQSTASQNGIYIVGATPARAADMNEDDEFAGTAVFIEEGTANADQGYVCITNETVTMDSSDIEFAQFTGTGAFTFGVGLVASGNDIHTSFANVAIPESEFASAVATDNTASPVVSISHRKLDENDFGSGEAPEAKANSDEGRNQLMFSAYLNGLLLNGRLTDDAASATDIVDLLSGNGSGQDANIEYDFVAVITELSSEFEFYMQTGDLSSDDILTFVYANNK